MFLQVCGAAREVTGSNYVVEVGKTRFLVDCGMHQGGEKEEALNFAPFSYDPREIAFVLLTHAHIDHSGRLPRLVRAGFSGPIYATSPTCDLAEIMLLDSAYIQEMEAEWRTRKAQRAGRKGQEPLYTQDDARKTIRLFRPVDYSAPLTPAPGVEVVFHDAGHILGSSFLELRLEDQGEKVKVLFSGDVGQPDQPIIRDPEIVTQTDYLLLESTYGDRLHTQDGTPQDKLAQILKEAKRDGGNVIIPAFAVGRTQELLFFLREIFRDYGLDMPVYVDSPLASKATEVFRRHPEAYDEESWKLVKEGGAFDFPQLHYTQSVDESRALNGKARRGHHLGERHGRRGARPSPPQAQSLAARGPCGHRGVPGAGNAGQAPVAGRQAGAALRRGDRSRSPHRRDHRPVGPRGPGPADGLGLALRASAIDYPHPRGARVCSHA